MNDEEKRKDTYERIRKRLKDYRWRSGFFTAGAGIWAVLFVLSLFPLVPVLIVAALGLAMYDWSITLWFLCIGVFGVLFWIFQRFAKKIEGKRGITLEERMYVPAYEAICYLREYTDPDHPVLGSRLKSVRRLQNILVLLGEVSFPDVSIVREEKVQLMQLWRNLGTRLIPSIEKRINRNDSSILGNVHSSLIALIDYLSEPKLNSLVTLNQTMASLPEIIERSIYMDFRSTLFRRTNMRHAIAFSVAAFAASLIAYIDLNYVGGSPHDAYTFGITSFIAFVALYVTYLGLTRRAR